MSQSRRIHTIFQFMQRSAGTFAACLFASLLFSGVSSAEDKAESTETGEASYNVADCSSPEGSDASDASTPDTGTEQIDMDEECEQVVK